MSQKPYATERFVPEPDGKSVKIIRSLVFENETGDTEEVPFSPDSRTAIRGPRDIYDWHGRKIELDANIEYIIEYFGYTEDAGSRSKSRDRLLVRKTNGKLAIAEVVYEQEEICEFMATIQNGALCPRHYSSYYSLRSGAIILEVVGSVEFDRIDESISETNVMRAFKPSYNSDPVVLYGYTNLYRPHQSEHCRIVYRHVAMQRTNPLCHRIDRNRDNIFSFQKNKCSRPPAPICVETLSTDIVVEEGGNKLVSAVRLADGSLQRIATDTEVVRCITDRLREQGNLVADMYWYFDGQ